MNERTKIFIFLTLGAILSGLAVAFSKYFGFLIWVSLIPLIMALGMLAKREKLKLRHAYLYGLFYFECFYAVCFHFFFYLYPLDFTGLNGFLSILVIMIACFGLSFLQALFGGFVFVLYLLTARGSLAKKIPATCVLSFTVIYTFYEFTQTLGWWGVPWGRISLALTDMIIPIQAASLFGSYFITAIIVTVNGLLAFALSEYNAAEKRKKYAFAALLIFVSNLGLGGALYGIHKSQTKGGDTVRVGVVQGNYDSTDKWFESSDKIVKKHLRLTEDAVKDGADIVLWAETALPFTLYEYDYYSYEIAETAKKLDTVIIVGAMSDDEDGYCNTLFCFTPEGKISETRYYKQHLVPFGEYVPMRSFIETVLPFMAEISMLEYDMTPGDTSSIFELEKTNAGALICFDSIYENLTRATVKAGAEVILLSTNDSWFSSSSAVYMHNNQARFRAVESGRYVARSANTGISSFISNTGEVIAELPILTEGYLCADLVNISSRTLYSKVGNIFVYLCGILTLVPIAYDIIIRLKENNDLQNGDKL